MGLLKSYDYKKWKEMQLIGNFPKPVAFSNYIKNVNQNDSKLFDLILDRKKFMKYYSIIFYVFIGFTLLNIFYRLSVKL
jgi:hypothetical protein